MITTVSTVKDDLARLERWIDRNQAAGVDRVVVFLDDRDDAQSAALLNERPGVIAIDARTWWGDGVPLRLNARQRINANAALDVVRDTDPQGWMFHIDGDEVLHLDTERLLALPGDIEAVQLSPLEALAQWEWPDDDVSLFKRLLTDEELDLLHLLGMLERPDNRAYFRGHTVGKAGLRVSTDAWLEIHRVVDDQRAPVAVHRADWLQVLHYESHTLEEFVRKWTNHTTSGHRLMARPERQQLASAMTADGWERWPVEVADRVRRELFAATVLDDRDGLERLDLLVAPVVQRPSDAPAPSDPHGEQIKQRLDALADADKSRFRLGEPGTARSSLTAKTVSRRRSRERIVGSGAPRMFSRVAIVNRGEAAMRLIHAVRDLNAEGDGAPIRSIALYTDDERTAMFAREADEAYSLGPASARPYIDLTVLERVLVECAADAVWVGWGFVAEDPAFADLCARLGVTFIGPSAEAMRRLGDKIGSKLLAEEVGVPVAPWSGGAVDTLEASLAAADRVGYPLMLKATAGGGGRGIRRVDSAAELEDAYQRTRDEAERAFGSGVVFLERLVTGARHIEVQLIADSHGTAWAVGVRDCTVQRRNQKVIEESASPLLDAGQTDEVKASAERLALAVGYVGAGTVEFLYHPGERTFAFLEVNTRLQVEHPITEATTDLDLVKAQLHVAAGGRLLGSKPVERGHAVEARLNAEDPDRDFAPSPGRIALLDLPSGPGIRVDTGVGEGDTIPADFDSMIAKIIAYGSTRDEALARLRRAMAETTVVIEGGATNKGFILDLLAQSEIVDGSTGWADTSWIDRVRAEGRLVVHEHSGIAVVAAGIEAYEDEAHVEVVRLLESARGGRPQVQHKVGRAVDFKLRGTTHKVTVIQIGPQRFRVGVEAGGVEHVVVADVERLDEFHTRLRVGDQRYRLVTSMHGPVHTIEVDGVTHRVSRDEGGVLRSPAPALVVASPVTVGDVVAAGAPGPGPREHEDGDGAASAVRGAGARAAGADRKPGRDRSPARTSGARRGGRRRGGSTGRDRTGPRPATLRAPRVRGGARRAQSRRRRGDGDGLRRRRERRRRRGRRLPRGPRRARRRRRRRGGRRDGAPQPVRRPGRAQPQPTRR